MQNNADILKQISDRNRKSLSRCRYMMWIEYFICRRCDKDWVCLPQYIPFTNGVYVAEGRGEYTIGDKIYKVSAGDFIYIPKGCYREAKTAGYESDGSQLLIYAVDFHIYDILGHELDFHIPPVTHLGYDAKLLKMLNHLNEIWTKADSMYDIDAMKDFYGILSYLTMRLKKPSNTDNNEDKKPRDNRIVKLSDYVLTHLNDKISCDAAAELLYLNKNYLNSVVKRETGFTLVNYINYLKINAAENMLQNENRSIEDIAASVGFNEKSYFTKVFKRMKGYLPSEVRQGR